MKIKKGLAIFMSVLVFCSVIFSTSAFAIVMSSQGFDFQRINSTSKAEIIGITPGSDLESSTSIIIPSSLGDCLITSIATNAFQNNTVQEEIVLPNTITNISSLAFNNAVALKTMTIPANVQTINSLAFNNCASLESITFKSTNLSIISRATFYGCKSLDNIIIPSSVNTIESMAFAECTSLNRIYIPSTVSVISNDAFLYANNVKIYGTLGTPAYYYAINKGIPFIELSENKSMLTLNNWITSAKYKLKEDLSEYIPSTVENLQIEYENAVLIKNDFFSTQSDIDNAAANLATAYRALKLTAMAELETAVETAKSLVENSSIYTNDSVNQLLNTIISAENVIQKSNPTSTEVNNMILQLNDKMNSLVFQSKVDLQTLVNQASEVIASSSNLYTETSILELTTAIANANSVLESTEATDDNYKSEISTLTQAYNSLVLLTMGDVNLDGNLTVADVLYVLKNIVGTFEFNERQQYVADMDINGEISVVDAIMIQRLILEL